MEARADVSNLLREGVRVGVESRTTYGCAEPFVRVLGLCAKEDVLGLVAHRWRDGVEAERRHVLILAYQRRRSRDWVGDFALPNMVGSIRLQGIRVIINIKTNESDDMLTSSAAIVTV